MCWRPKAEAAAARLSPSSGRMVQAVWFDGGAGQAGRLLLVIHHLVVDGVSWRILVPDLAAAWQAAGGGPCGRVRGSGDVIPGWSLRLLSQARDAGLVAEVGFWRKLLEQPCAGGCGTARLDGGARRCRDRGTSDVAAAGAGDGCAVDAGAGAVPWRHPGGAADRACGCGRGVVPASRSWRWCCGAAGGRGPRPRGGAWRGRPVGDGGLVHQPVSGRLDVSGLDLAEAVAGGASLGRALKRIKEQVRAVPGKGLGYGLLRYLNAEKRLRRCAAYAGAAAWGSTTSGGLRWGRAATGALPTRAKGLRRWMRRCRFRTGLRSTR